MSRLYAPPEAKAGDSPLAQQLTRGGAFELHRAGARVFAARPSALRARGILWFIVPRMRVWLRGAAWRVRPDPRTVFVLVVLLGGLVIELTQDRVTMPRDYPPLFVYGYALMFGGLTIREVVVTRRAVLAALA